jgi:hypothetical protein
MIRQFLLRALPVAAFGALSCAAMQGPFDLTGVWQDNVGGKYAIRQVGGRVAWIDDGRPTYINVFQGTISGTTLTGEWIDVPGGQLQNTGRLTLRIESNSRMVVVDSSSPTFGAAVITRGGTSGGGCDISGTWRVKVRADWPETESVWTFTSLGGGRYSGTEKGMGNATGTATVNGDILHLDWLSVRRLFGEDVREEGYMEWRLDAACRLGEGTWRSNTKNQSANSQIQRVQTCDISGPWRNKIDANWEATESIWTFTSIGGNRYGAREQGMGNATGTAVLVGDSLHLDYEGPTRRLFGEDVKDTGSYDWKLDASCNFGDGKISRGNASHIERYKGGSTTTTQSKAPICDNPRALVVMDEWLARAVPLPSGPGYSLRYDPWCRPNGQTPTAYLSSPNPPDTAFTRCEYLWFVCGEKPSANGLGTLREYLLKNLR